MPFADPEVNRQKARERMRRLRADPAYQEMRYQRETERRHWRLGNDPEWAARYRAVNREASLRYYYRVRRKAKAAQK